MLIGTERFTPTSIKMAPGPTPIRVMTVASISSLGIGSGGGWITTRVGIMNLKRLHIQEIKKIYIDNLNEWVEVPVWDQEEIIRLVNEIDWEGLDMRQYKKMLVELWPGLSSSVKSKLKNPAARDELYEVLIHENWGLAPAEALGNQFVYTEIEKKNVEDWFASAKTKGRPPVVL